MGALADARAQVAAIFTDALTLPDKTETLPVVTYGPDQLQPPQVWVHPAESFISTDGMPGRMASLSYWVDVVLAPGQRSTADAAVEAMTEQALDVTFSPEHPWVLADVGLIELVISDAAAFPCVRITVTHPVQFTTD